MFSISAPIPGIRLDFLTKALGLNCSVGTDIALQRNNVGYISAVFVVVAIGIAELASKKVDAAHIPANENA